MIGRLLALALIAAPALAKAPAPISSFGTADPPGVGGSSVALACRARSGDPARAAQGDARRGIRRGWQGRARGGTRCSERQTGRLSFPPLRNDHRLVTGRRYTAIAGAGRRDLQLHRRRPWQFGLCGENSGTRRHGAKSASMRCSAIGRERGNCSSRPIAQRWQGRSWRAVVAKHHPMIPIPARNFPNSRWCRLPACRPQPGSCGC